MLINKDPNCVNSQDSHVEFVSYTGKFPNRCRGVLTLKIDGEEVKFGHDFYDYNICTGKFLDNNYESFWITGGGITGNYHAYSGEWDIDFESIPKQYQKYAIEIDEVFNSNVLWGCCGGCI